MAALAEGWVAALPGNAVPLNAGTVDRASTAKGAYILVIDIGGPLPVRFARTRAELAPGRYAYAGSAFGPGGLGARLSRHFRRDKKPHWHVDALTVAAREMRAFAIEGANECDLVQRLLATGRFSAPLPGFGSTDCRTCASHLLALTAS